MDSRTAKCGEHDVDPTTYVRDVIVRVGKVSDVPELTYNGWKQRWTRFVEGP